MLENDNKTDFDLDLGSSKSTVDSENTAFNVPVEINKAIIL